MSSASDQIDVFVGVDVGKASHHAVALSVAGAVLLDRALPQDEAALIELVTALKRHGRVLFVVDQPATIARVLVEISGRHFASAAHLAAYAGLAPVTRRSGTSIRGEHTSQRGNRRLKRALYLSAFASLRDPTSRAYYDRKRGEGKSHQHAPLALARRQCDVLFAMMRDRSKFDREHRAAA